MSGIWGRVSSAMDKHHLWCMLVYLTMLEIVVFASVVSRVGFYLDDWGMLSDLTFAPGAAVDKILWFLLKDPKIIIRPIEALHFGALFAIAGAKPMLWHLVNGAMEVIAAWLFYICLYIASKNKLIATLAAAFFLLCPTHDCTHYWVLASSASLSMMCWLGSLACTLIAARDGKPALHWLSLLLFTISVFNYELFVPLAALNVLASWWLANLRAGELSSEPIRPFSRKSLAVPILVAFGYAASIASYLAWVRIIIPNIGVGYIHPIHFSAETMINTVLRGVAVSLPFEQVPFYAAHTSTAFDATAIGACLSIASLTALVVIAFKSERLSFSRYVALLAAVAVVIPVSYTIFGLNPEYTPTLMTITNRVNYGASLGTCLLYALIAVAVGSIIGRKKPFVAQFASAGLAALILASFTLSDRAMSKPWALSWTMQKHVASLIKSHSIEIAAANCIMLINSPRYVMWAPVFDGTWDFENLIRVTLKDKEIHAGVVSERLKLNRDSASDISSDFVCGTYPFEKMIAIVAPQSLFIPIDSADEFIACVQQYGFGFELDRSMPDKWRQQVIAGRQTVSAKPY